MKIYTKTGDHGTTSLYKIGRVSKTDVRVHAAGDLDEFNASLGLLLSGLEAKSEVAQDLLRIQDMLFQVGATVASSDVDKEVALPVVDEAEILKLEKAIDQMQKELPEQKYFILPGGGEQSSRCHLARTICRRAERVLVELHHEFPQAETHLKFLNRLSDYLFVLARKFANDAGHEETYWIPECK
jgi:cob(I)alamin adenosyltransferase